jgi:hypothetical protein
MTAPLSGAVPLAAEFAVAAFSRSLFAARHMSGFPL